MIANHASSADTAITPRLTRAPLPPNWTPLAPKAAARVSAGSARMRRNPVFQRFWRYCSATSTSTG